MYAGDPSAALDWTPEGRARACAYRRLVLSGDDRVISPAPVGYAISGVRAVIETIGALAKALGKMLGRRRG